MSRVISSMWFSSGHCFGFRIILCYIPSTDLSRTGPLEAFQLKETSDCANNLSFYLTLKLWTGQFDLLSNVPILKNSPQISYFAWEKGCHCFHFLPSSKAKILAPPNVASNLFTVNRDCKMNKTMSHILRI